MASSKTQWGWAELEQLLQCPVCFDPPSTGVVQQCFFGHHICSSCLPKVDACPLCKCSFRGTRNFVVEEIMRHFEILKNTMLLTAITDVAEVKKEKVKEPVAVRCKQPSTADATKGIYPCGFRNCNVKLPIARILNHVRSCHPKELIEAKLNNSGTFSIQWMLNSTSNKNLFVWQKALFISGIGLVFFNYELLPIGLGLISCQMAAQYKVTSKYNVKISLHHSTQQNIFTTKLVSTRENMQNMIPKNVCMILDKTTLERLTENGQFKCSLEFSLCSPNDVFHTSLPIPLLPTGFYKMYKDLLDGYKSNRN